MMDEGFGYLYNTVDIVNIVNVVDIMDRVFVFLQKLFARSFD